jgi:hypothetical protein
LKELNDKSQREWCYGSYVAKYIYAKAATADFYKRVKPRETPTLIDELEISEDGD